jgi:LEA14-like dessication related protein
MKALRTAMAAIALAALGGCFGMTSDLQAPRLTLVSANMTSADVFSQQFRVRIRAVNPNSMALPVKSIDYQLFLEGDSFAEGVSEAAFVVPANGEKEFDLTLRTNFVSSIGRLLSRLTGESRTSIQYTFMGTVVADMRFSPKLKFSETGAVDLARK